MAAKPPKNLTWPTSLTFIGVVGLAVFLSLNDVPGTTLGLIGGALIFFGWLSWFLAKRWDRKNAILDSAPLIPMKFLEVDDDAWVKGSAWSDNPVFTPYFNQESLHYFYRLEEYVSKTRIKSDGSTETYSEWETRKTDSNQIDFQISQDCYSLTIKAKEAQFCHEQTAAQTLGSLRHSCTFLPNHSNVHAIGVVGEGRRSLGPKAHVPLIITTKGRDEFLAASEQNEQNAKNMGFLFFLFGTFILGLALVSQRETITNHDSLTSRPGLILISAIGAFFITTLIGFIHLFNRLVIFRARVRERWSQVDVNLKQRFDLLPNLSSILSEIKLHESSVQEMVAKTRSLAVIGNQKQQISNEKSLSQGVISLLALQESYPELKSNTAFLKASNDLIALENKIAHARELFNNAVMEFNSQAESFPTLLFARILGFTKQDYFSV